MKIEELIEEQKKTCARDILPPLQKRVLIIFEMHKGEVFTYSDEVIIKEMSDIKKTAINWSVWALAEKKFLKKTKVGRRTYFGFPEDIDKLESSLEKIKK